MAARPPEGQSSLYLCNVQLLKKHTPVNGTDTPLNISPNRFTITDETELKRLTGLM
jgi:hypothetical protein